MIRYHLYVRGVKEPLFITDVQKLSLEKALNDVDAPATTSIGKNLIKLSDIKGIFEIEKDTLQVDSRRKMDQTDNEWNGEMIKMANDDITQKVMRELTIRIFPELFLRRGLIEYQEDVVMQIKKILISFFSQNTGFPRCPAKYWFPLLKKSIHNPFVAKFYEIIANNDSALYVWCKKYQIKEVSLQLALDSN